MKFRIERSRLQDMIRSSLMYASKTKTKKGVIWEASPDGIETTVSDANIIGGRLVYEPSWFLSYNVSEDTEIPIIRKYYNTVRKNFNLTEMTVELTGREGNREIAFRTNRTEITDDAKDIETRSLNIGGVVKNGVFRKEREQIVSVILDAGVFNNIPSVDTDYRIVSDGNELRISCESKVNFNRKLELDEVRELGGVRTGVAAPLFRQLLANISGKIWFGICEGPRGLLIQLSKMESEYRKLYVQAEAVAE